MKRKKHLCSIPVLAMLSVAVLGLALGPAPAVRQEGASPAPFSHGQANLDRSTKPQVLESYGNLPLSFEANHGQTDRQVKFLSRGRGYGLFLTASETVLSLSNPATSTARRRIDPVAMGQEGAENNAITTNVLRMRLVGANPSAEISGLEQLPGKSNYFIGNDPKQWRTNVPSYARVKYRNVYPGVDLVYHGNQRELEYDFVIAPGGDPQAIALRVQGADRVEVDTQGDLVLHTAVGPIRQRKPVIYQEVNGVRREIAGGYVLQGARKVGFQVATYDPGRPLVIDPILVYSTFLGGCCGDVGNGIAVDALGNAYVTGQTRSPDFPTRNAFQPTFGGGAAAFVTKLNPTGSALVYSTFLGGSGDGAVGLGIAVDALGNAYVAGSTDVSDFPTTAGAFQPSCPPNAFSRCSTSAFATKLNADGSLGYSTYLGPGAQAHGIAVDALGSAYVMGQAGFPGGAFPTTPGAFQTARRGSNAAFVMKLDPLGSFLVYSTFLSSSGSDDGNGIAVDALGNAYVTGGTQSSDFPTTAGAFQPACPPHPFALRKRFRDEAEFLGLRSPLLHPSRRDS